MSSLGACQAPPTTAPAPAAALPQLDPGPRPDAAPRRGPPDLAPLRAVQRQLRLRHFARQRALEIPAALGPRLPALRPPGEDFKVVAFELKRRMALSQPAPERRSELLRCVTRLEDAALTAALQARLVSEGWAAPGAPLEAGYAHPERGVLALTVKVFDEKATVVEWRLDRPAEAGPLEAAEGLLSTPPPWLEIRGWPAPPVGYELSVFHARGAGILETDVERLAVALPGEAAALQAGLEAQARAAGFTPHPEGDLRDTTGRRLALLPRPFGLLVIHQRRWRSLEAPAEAQR